MWYLLSVVGLLKHPCTKHKMKIDTKVLKVMVSPWHGSLRGNKMFEYQRRTLYT